MSLSEKIIAILLISIPWLKAGLAGEWLTDGFSLVIFILFIFSAYKNKHIYKKGWLILIPLIYLFLLLFISSFNQKYQRLDYTKWKSINFEYKLAAENDLEKAQMINNHFRNIILIENENPHLALAIFFNLKNLYKEKYGITNSPSLEIIEDYEKLITLNTNNYIPQSITKSRSSVSEYLYIISSIVLFYLCYITANSKRVIRRMLLYLLISSAILACIGIYQKYHFIHNDSAKEILGIWNAPEPRYFYSTFTYKNHWSCFAIIFLSIGFSFLLREIIIMEVIVLRSKSMILLIVIISILLISIVHSGSRSGIVVSITLFLILIFTYKTLTRYIKYISLSLIIITSSVIYSIGQNSTNEMSVTSKQQFADLMEGKLPLRLLLWNDLLKQISVKTFWGYGFNSFKSINSIYQSSEVLKIRNAGLKYAHNPYTPLVGHGHNDWLELLSEIGWVGFSFVLLPAFLLILREVISSKSIFAKILFLGCLSYCLFSFIDFPVRTPACFITFCAVLGFALKYSRLTETQ